MLWHQLNIQKRVIGALLIREIYTRFGREGLGFLWIFLEPLVFAVPVLLMWSILRVKFEHGVMTMPLVITGYLPILVFRHLGSQAISLVRSNIPLLYHRNVTLLDIFIARSLLEILSNLAALFVVFLLFMSLKEMFWPKDFSLFYVGYFFTIWWSISMSLLIAGLAPRWRVVEKIWPVYSYTYLVYSGFWYLADWLPPTVRNFALYQPSLQAYEMIRGGMFGKTIKTYGDPAYTSLVLTVLTLIGLSSICQARKYITIE